MLISLRLVDIKLCLLVRVLGVVRHDGISVSEDINVHTGQLTTTMLLVMGLLVTPLEPTAAGTELFMVA